MKFIHEDKNPKNGDSRVITKFLFFPMRLGDTTIWLESAKIYQVYVKDKNILPFLPIQLKLGWNNIRFEYDD